MKIEEEFLYVPEICRLSKFVPLCPFRQSILRDYFASVARVASRGARDCGAFPSLLKSGAIARASREICFDRANRRISLSRNPRGRKNRLVTRGSREEAAPLSRSSRILIEGSVLCSTSTKSHNPRLATTLSYSGTCKSCAIHEIAITQAPFSEIMFSRLKQYLGAKRRESTPIMI